MKMRALLTSGLLICGAIAVGHAQPKGGKKDMPAQAGPKKGNMPEQAGPKKDAPETTLNGRAEIKSADGKAVGVLLLEETPNGVIITADLQNLPAGVHAFHIHETGKCEAPFKTAGAHFNPMGKKHGMKSTDGHHAGDLPNVHVPDGGKVRFEAMAHGVTLKSGEKNSLMDADGSAFVLHAAADDNKTDPAGAAGDRIACGVVTLSNTATAK